MHTDQKKAILVVSFGTSYAQTRERTIDKIEEKIQQAYPQIPVFRAWTSKRILKKIAERDRLYYDHVPEAMERLEKQGFREVIVQPTHIMRGLEYDKMRADVLEYGKRFAQISIGEPLLGSVETVMELAKVLTAAFSGVSEKEAVVFMGHGTSHLADMVYPALNYVFLDRGKQNLFVGTVEGYPQLPSVMRQLKAGGYRKVYLAPLMFVAGDHIVNDMAGAEPDSWKSQLEAAGYETECCLRGLGEYPEIQEIYLRHLQRALQGEKE